RTISQSSAQIKEKKDLPRDPFQPIQRFAKRQGSTIYFRSILTGYIEGTGGSGHLTREDSSVYYQFNRPIIDLYKTALKISFSQLLVEMNDEYFTRASSYNSKNLYCYQLFLPPEVDERKVQAIIVDDLNKQFDLNGRWEKREVPCLV